jgi:hypothetical protein
MGVAIGNARHGIIEYQKVEPALVPRQMWCPKQRSRARPREVR